MHEHRILGWDWLIYSDYLESEIGNYLIECSIKTRMIQDLIQESGQANPYNLDESASSNLDLGVFKNGSPLKGIRDSCNRIVHATEARLVWDTSTDEEGISFEYWNGIIELNGEQNGVEWHLNLNTHDWCIAMKYFYDEINENVDLTSLWRH